MSGSLVGIFNIQFLQSDVVTLLRRGGNINDSYIQISLKNMPVKGFLKIDNYS